MTNTIRLPLRQEKHIAALIGTALLIATYLAFSLRSVTDPFAPGDLLDLKRFVAVGVGAGMFLVVARHARANWAAMVPARIVGIALLSAAASGLVLATRVAYDVVSGQDDATAMVRNMRWTIIWLGYFGTALLGYFAVVFAMSLRLTNPLVTGTRQDRMAALVTEVSSWSPAERRMVVALLDAPVPYECADPLFASAVRD